MKLTASHVTVILLNGKAACGLSIKSEVVVSYYLSLRRIALRWR